MNIDWYMLIVDGFVCGCYWALGISIDLQDIYSRTILGTEYLYLLKTNIFVEEDVFNMMLYIFTSSYFVFIFATFINFGLFVFMNGLNIGYTMFFSEWIFVGYIIVFTMLSTLSCGPDKLFGNEPNTIITKLILKKSKIKCSKCNFGFDEMSIIEYDSENIKHFYC